MSRVRKTAIEKFVPVRYPATGEEQELTIGYRTRDPYALRFTTYSLHGPRTRRVSRDTVLQGLWFLEATDAVVALNLSPITEMVTVYLRPTHRKETPRLMEVDFNRLYPAIGETLDMVPFSKEHLYSGIGWDLPASYRARCAVCGWSILPDQAVHPGCEQKVGES